MSENELLLRERLNVTSGRMSKSETTQTTRVLRDDELDAVSGGLKVNMEDILVTSLKVTMEDVTIS